MKKNYLKITAGVMSSAMLIGLCAAGVPAKVIAATEHWNDASASATQWNQWKNNWNTYSSNYEHVSLTPGADQTQLNLAWYSHTTETPAVRIATKQNMDGAKEFAGTQTEAVTIDGVKYFSNKAIVKDLKENTKYYYQVFQNGKWQDAETYTTKSFDSFSFLYVGDPQIGASKNQTSTEQEKMVSAGNEVSSAAKDNLAARNDGYNWNNILNDAVKDHEDVSFIVSAGDQVNAGKNEREYAAYLGADALASLPVATTIGNHDSVSNQYTLHFNNPNAFSDKDANYIQGKTEAGTDYYYRYGNTLFMVLDTNNYNCATHENVMKKAISENKDAKWRIVVFHQDIYGSGYDHSDSDGMVLRTQLTPLMDKYDVDVVLQGHDHTYSRTYQLQGDGKSHTAYGKDVDMKAADYITQNNCYQIVSDTESGEVVNPKGTVYLEANSATGSKFYNLIATQQDYISERSQTWTPSYSVVSVTDDSFTVTTYDTTTRQELSGSSTYTIVKKAVSQKITGNTSYKKQVGAKAFKLNAKAKTALTYTSSNKKVAIVDKNGKVTVKGAGKAVITVKAAATDEYQAATQKVTIQVSAKKTAKK